MPNIYITDHTFLQTDTIKVGEYENCAFNDITFEDNDLSNYQFIDCTFNNCNLSLAKMNKTVFRDVIFKDCKMLGMHFDTCNEYGLVFSFDGCQLNHSSFYKTKIKKTSFKNCQLQETDFTDADLSNGTFENCDLSGAVFDHTNLERVDFRTAFNYSINPEINQIKKARFSQLGLSGLLDKYDIDVSG